MSFLSPTDFDVVPYNLANNDNSSFPDFIQSTEDKALKNLLGLSFYTELKRQVALLPAEWVADNAPGYAVNDQVVYGTSIWKSLIADNLNNVPAENANWELLEVSDWLKFIKGDYYVYGLQNKQYYWNGLVDMLQPLVYGLWIKYTQFSHSKHGMVKARVENAEVINPAYFIAKGYNDFAEKAGNCFNPINTLWGYLYQTAASPTWDDTFDVNFYKNFLDYFQQNFKNPKRMNMFNI